MEYELCPHKDGRSFTNNNNGSCSSKAFIQVEEILRRKKPDFSVYNFHIHESNCYNNSVVFATTNFKLLYRVLFGCFVDEFFDFSKLNPFAAVTAGKVLEGEMFRMMLSKPKNGNAQHLCAVSVVHTRSLD